MSLAEEREDKLRGELAAAGDESALRLQLRAYDDRDRLSGEADTVRAAVSTANDEHSAAVAALTVTARRRSGRRRPGGCLPGARGGEGHRPGGQSAGAPACRCPCPVCEQPVARVPAVPADSAVAAATAAGKAARAATKAAQTVVQQRDAAARDLERLLVQARARQEQVEAGWPTWTGSSPARRSRPCCAGSWPSTPGCGARWTRRRRRFGGREAARQARPGGRRRGAAAGGVAGVRRLP
ncbi:hypothetical protein NKG94_23505 [Micromonospora sp. M12]